MSLCLLELAPCSWTYAEWVASRAAEGCHWLVSQAILNRVFRGRYTMTVFRGSRVRGVKDDDPF